MDSISNSNVHFVLDVLYLLMISATVYFLHLVVQGMFLKKIKQKRGTKYFTAIFPAALLFILATERRGILIYDKDILFFVAFLLFLHTGLLWHWIFSKSIIDRKITSFQIQTTFFILFCVPFLGIFIMAFWLFISRNRQELYFFGGPQP